MVMMVLTAELALLCVTVYALCMASHDADEHMETIMQNKAEK